MSAVKITKLETLQDTDSNVTDGYWVVGEWLVQPEVGRSVVLARDIRNGVPMQGLFTTSPVTSLVERDGRCVQFSTENSVYNVEPWEQ